MWLWSIYIDIIINFLEIIFKFSKVMEELGVEMLDVFFNDCFEGVKSDGGMGLVVMVSGFRKIFERVEFIF